MQTALTHFAIPLLCIIRHVLTCHVLEDLIADARKDIDEALALVYLAGNGENRWKWGALVSLSMYLYLRFSWGSDAWSTLVETKGWVKQKTRREEDGRLGTTGQWVAAQT